MSSRSGAVLVAQTAIRLLPYLTLLLCELWLCADTVMDDLIDDGEMMSEEDFERQSIYHVPDKPCPPYALDRIRRTLPSNLTLQPSAAEPNVSCCCFTVYVNFSSSTNRFLPRDVLLSAVYAVVVCLCVCICLPHSGIVSKRLNIGSRK